MQKELSEVPVYGLMSMKFRFASGQPYTPFNADDTQNIYSNRSSGSVRWNARERRVETNENSIGTLPSIGLSAEF